MISSIYFLSKFKILKVNVIEITTSKTENTYIGASKLAHESSDKLTRFLFSLEI